MENKKNYEKAIEELSLMLMYLTRKQMIMNFVHTES